MVAIVQTADPAGVATSSNIATYSTVSIGTASSDRIIAVTSTALNLSINSATIDYGSGDVAMSATSLASSGITRGSARIFYLAVPTGTTATFKITYDATGASTANHITVYSITGSNLPLSNSGIDTTTTGNTDPLSVSITIPTSGGFLACAAVSGTGSYTWGSATEDIDAATTGTPYNYSTATRFTSGSATVTATSTGNNRGGLAYVIFSSSGGQTISAGVAGAGNLSIDTISVQQAQVRFAGAGSLYATLVPNSFQFITAIFGGSGNLRANLTQRGIIGARFVGTGNLNIDTLSVPFGRARFVGAGSLQINTIHIVAPLPPDLTLHAGEWPVALPECPVLNGFSEQRQRNAIEFQPEVGFTKLHRRATTSVVQTSVTFRMTDSEVDIFNEWYVDYQDDGTLEFTWDHPITKVSYLWMFDAQDAPRIERMTPDTFRVSFNLLRLD